MFGVSFLSPLFLLGALAAAVPIVLHLFRRRTDLVIDFPAMHLLARAPVQQTRRRRLRELVLLALRVAALVILAVSFARPYFSRTVAPASAPLTVVAVDTSLSLSAPGQMDRARAAAREAIESAPSGHAVAVVSFNDTATVVAPPTTDRRGAADAAARLEAGPGGTRYRTALAKATEVIGAREGRVVIITDLQQAGWDANDNGGLPDGVDAVVVPVPRPAGNLAVTSAERRDGVVQATVQNFGADAVTTPVRLVVGGQPVAEVQADLAPAAAVSVRLAGQLPASGTADVAVDDATGYAEDNVRHLALDPPPSLKVTVVVADPAGKTSGIYVDRALGVAGGGREFDVDVVDGRTLSAWDAAAMAERAAVVIVGTRTLDRRGRQLLRDYVTGGGQVLVTLGPDVDPATLEEVVGVDVGVEPAPVRPESGAATLVATDARHPIFRPFLDQSGALGDVRVEQYRRLKEEEGRNVLARFTGGDVALAEQAAGRGRVLVFASDLDNQWGRFPLQPSFVPFAVEAARYLTESRRGPDLSASDANAAHESNPASTSVDEFLAGINRIRRAAAAEPMQDARAVEARQRWWQTGLLLMFVALAGEALVGRRAV